MNYTFAMPMRKKVNSSRSIEGKYYGGKGLFSKNITKCEIGRLKPKSYVTLSHNAFQLIFE